MLFFNLNQLFMRVQFSFLFLMLWHCINAQTVQLNYESVYNGTRYDNLMLANDSVSIWEAVPDPNAADQVDDWLIKTYSDSSAVLLDYIFQKKFYVKDLLHPMRWETDTAKKIILGYLCHAAKTVFRGRSYMAYYTSDIPLRTGPWKFGGLPGLILEVSSADDMYRFSAINIHEAADIHLSEYDLHENEQISWEIYCKKVIDTINQYVRYMQSVSNNPGSQVNLRIERPEIIYPIAQNGLGISSE